MATACKYGTHRVLEPIGVLPQPAKKLNNDFSTLYDNEILVDVTALNIDSASFTQISEACGGDEAKIGEMILDIVNERGKMQNPVTGSGGMFIGTVHTVGAALKDCDLKPGDKIASLVSLSLTPLRIDKIVKIIKAIDRVEIVGQAVLFESGLYAKLPDDMEENLVLAALDVAGAPAQTAKLVKPGDSVLVIGANGKSGMLVSYEAKKRVGPNGNVVGAVIIDEPAHLLQDLVEVTFRICNFFTIDPNVSGSRFFQLVDAAHQRAFPRSGGTDNGNHIPVVDNSIHILQWSDVWIYFLQMFDFNHWSSLLSEYFHVSGVLDRFGY